MSRLSIAICLLLGLVLAAVSPAQPRPFPPPGNYQLTPEERAQVETKLQALDQRIESLHENLDKRLRHLLPDVEIFSRGVAMALKYGEFNRRNNDDSDVRRVHVVLDEGLKRADELGRGLHSWTRQKGLVPRGYRSKLDDTVIPYGVRIPESYSFDAHQPFRVDLMFHGMHVDRTDMRFVYDRMTWQHMYQPEGAIALHVYGRYCNSMRFAGEVDVFEALEACQKAYRVDRDRIAVRGFSMGGNAAWHFTIHHAGIFFAANPGAGWVEVPKFKRFEKNPRLVPAGPLGELEMKMWRMFDADKLAINLRHIPTVAYSGERDGQKQAADLMSYEAAKEGIQLMHLVAPNTGHDMHPDFKPLIEAKLSGLQRAGRERVPERIRYATFTLKYNQLAWITINGLERHWERAQINADIVRAQGQATGIEIATENIDDVIVDFPAGDAPFDVQAGVTVRINGSEIPKLKAASDRSFTARFTKVNGVWRLADSLADPPGTLAKRPNLQGPIDDAFMDRFLFVRPTGAFANETVGKWVHSEMERAVYHWLHFYRGDVRIKNDTEVTAEDAQDSNLILWGCPQSNAVLRQVADRLPLRWDGNEVAIGNVRGDAARHAAIMIYPNPLNPKRYVVLNSCFTFREQYLGDPARHSPFLADWAIVDLSVPADRRFPGRIVGTDFFDERWQFNAASKPYSSDHGPARP